MDESLSGNRVRVDGSPCNYGFKPKNKKRKWKN